MGMIEKIKDIKELEEKGLYIITKEDRLVDNNVKEILDEKNMTISDLSRLTGVSRQYISQVIQYKIKPGVDFALKVSHILDLKVEDIFSINTDCWYRAYNKDYDLSMYLDVVNLEIIDNNERLKRIKETGYEYYNQETKEYLNKNDINDKNTYSINLTGNRDRENIIKIYERLWEKVIN